MISEISKRFKGVTPALMLGGQQCLRMEQSQRNAIPAESARVFCALIEKIRWAE